MKAFTAAALVSILSVGMAREVYFEHPGALKTIAKRDLHTFSERQAQNLATFTGALGGIEPTAITCSGDATRQFQVKADTFVNFGAAAQRSCDQQQNACSNAANAGGTDFSVSDCQAQQQQCNSVQSASAGSCSAGAASGANSNGNAGAASNANATANCGSAKRRRNVHGMVKA